MPRLRLYRLVWVVFLIVFAACAARPVPEPTATSDISYQPTPSLRTVVAEGRLYPYKHVSLSFNREGEVSEIMVREGQTVKKGEVIARLRDDKAAYAELALAHQKLIDAQQALEDVIKEAGVDNAKALQAIAEASENLRRAQHRQYNFTVPTRLAAYDLFEAANKSLDRVAAARKAYEPYKSDLADSKGLADIPPTLCIPASLCKGLTLASKEDSPARRLREELTKAEGDLQIAVNQIKITANVMLAAAQLEKAQSDYQKLNGNPDPDKLETAKLRVKAAEWEVKAAQKAVDDLSITAPFDGTVAKVNLKIGEIISAGSPAVQFADTSRWIVETSNLTEIQVVKINVGQKAAIRVDAIPGETFEGVVQSIRDVYEEKQGDVTYMVKLDLKDRSPKFRWGMTVVATFNENP